MSYQASPEPPRYLSYYDDVSPPEPLETIPRSLVCDSFQDLVPLMQACETLDLTYAVDATEPHAYVLYLFERVTPKLVRAALRIPDDPPTESGPDDPPTESGPDDPPTESGPDAP